MRIARTYRFSAAHRLPHTPPEHKCHHMHGHTYEVQLTLTGPVDPTTGWVLDFGVMDIAWDAIAGHLDHTTLNDHEGLENPTSEVLCLWLWARLDTYFGGLNAAEIYEIAVSETAGRSWATLGR